MPKIKSAKKALRQNKTRRARNLARAKFLKDSVRKYKKSVDLGQTDEARKQLTEVYSRLDKSVKVNLIKKNKAARMKSRLTQLMARSTKTSS